MDRRNAGAKKSGGLNREQFDKSNERTGGIGKREREQGGEDQGGDENWSDPSWNLRILNEAADNEKVFEKSMRNEVIDEVLVMIRDIPSSIEAIVKKGLETNLKRIESDL